MAEPSAPPIPASSRFVGRSRELAALLACYGDATAGRVGVALVTGEPGIGKTRLLEEAAAEAAAGGATVLRGGASEAEGMPPYLPFLEALGRYIRAAPAAQLRAQTGSAAAILATVLPEIGVRLGDLAPGYALPPEQARLRLYEAVGDFLAAIASGPPLLLILDDLQWADPASLDLLCHVVRRHRDASLFVLGASRAGEVAGNAPLERALAELTRLRVLTTVTVGPLAEEAIRALGASILGAAIDPALTQLLHARSEGNPFFIEELLRYWLEAGALSQHEDGVRLIRPLDGAVPPSIAGAIRQRLARLHPDVVEALRAAALIGRTFEVALLAVVLGREVEEVEDLLDNAARARIIDPPLAGVHAFCHDTIRQSLSRDLSESRRARLHGAIGRAIETRDQPGKHRRVADLAYHFARSGDRALGATYARQAADLALHSYAPDDAMAHYRAALDLSEQADARRGDLLLGLGTAALLAGAEPAAAGAFAEALAWFERHGERDTAAHAAHGLGRARWRLEELAAAGDAFDRALDLLGETERPELVQVLVDRGSLLAVSLHRQGEGLASASRAQALARRLGDTHLEAMANRATGNLLVRGNDLAGGVALLERALALASAADDLAEAAECCACLATAHYWQGDLPRLLATAERWRDVARRSREPFQARHIDTWLAAVATIRGNWTGAERALSRAEASVERLASPQPQAFLAIWRGVLAYYQGDYAAAERILDSALDILRPIGPGTLVWFLGWLGLARAANGQREAALACANELEALLASVVPGTMAAGVMLTHLTALALVLADRERAMRHRPALLPFAGQYHEFLVDTLLAEVAILAEDWPAAQAHLDRAEDQARRAELRSEVGRALIARANLERGRGGRGSPARAGDLLARAEQSFRDLGMAGEAARIRQRSAASGPPAGLSPREAEVLRLVSAGKSNREIAGALHLSEKTVTNHLTAILTKTGTDNRTAAAAFAIRHGLA